MRRRTKAEWLIMIYSDADDNVLEEDMMIDLQEAELVGSTDQVDHRGADATASRAAMTAWATGQAPNVS